MDKCKWVKEQHVWWDVWATSCRKAFVFEDGGPEENDFRFCPFCGLPLLSGGKVLFFDFPNVGKSDRS